MDPVRARQGKLIAGIGGLALFGFLFLPWFGEAGANLTGWEGQTTTDIYLLITAMVAVAAALPNTRALLGGVATVLLIWLAFIAFPSATGHMVGVYLALVAAIVITIGGFMSAQGGPGTARARART